MFNSTALNAGTSVMANYTCVTSNLVDSMIATKTSGVNVVKGSLVS